MKPIKPRKAKIREMVEEIIKNAEVGEELTSYSVMNKIIEINPAYAISLDVKSIVSFIRGHPQLERGGKMDNKVRIYIKKEMEDDRRSKNEPSTLQTERTKEATY